MIEVRRAADRPTTIAPGVTTHHSFSFGIHYDPGNVGLGPLVVHNDEEVAPSHGYHLHEHAGVEIVTWVAEGTLRHEDSTGDGGTVAPGQVQRLSAGAGVRHAEWNGSTTSGLRFVQAWLRAEGSAPRPAYEQAEVTDALTRGGWVLLVSGLRSTGPPALPLGARAALWAARLPAATVLGLPTASRGHLFVVDGTVTLEGPDAGPGVPLGRGDAARWGVDGAQADARGVTAVTRAELLLWELPEE